MREFTSVPMYKGINSKEFYQGAILTYLGKINSIALRCLEAHDKIFTDADSSEVNQSLFIVEVSKDGEWKWDVFFGFGTLYSDAVMGPEGFNPELDPTTFDIIGTTWATKEEGKYQSREITFKKSIRIKMKPWKGEFGDEYHYIQKAMTKEVMGRITKEIKKFIGLAKKSK